MTPVSVIMLEPVLCRDLAKGKSQEEPVITKLARTFVYSCRLEH